MILFKTGSFVPCISFDCRQFSKLKVKEIRNKHILINLISFVIRRRRFPTKRKLLTDDEYWRQGQEETRKALAELRQHVRSPDCNAWKTISRLNSPHRYGCIKIYYQLRKMLCFLFDKMSHMVHILLLTIQRLDKRSGPHL